MKRTKISDQITYIEPSDMSNFKACAGIIINSSLKILIDTNMGKKTEDLIKNENPDIAIISHYHIDHSLWGSTVLDHSKAALFIPDGEEKHLTDIEYFINETAAPFGLIDQWREFLVNTSQYRPLTDYKTYTSKDIFSANNIKIECIDTKGHSPSHKSFYFPDEKIIFTGDLGIDRFGPWYGWADCNINNFIDSLLRLKSYDAELILTSHGSIIKNKIKETFNECIKKIFDREIIIQKKLENGLTKDEIIHDGIWYQNKDQVKEPMKSFLYMWDSITFDHHVNMLNNGGLNKIFPSISCSSKT